MPDSSWPAIHAWESAEVVRSDIEAAATPDASLVIGPRKLQRYARPPADTAFPLEYSYHLLGDVPGQRVVLVRKDVAAVRNREGRCRSRSPSNP